MVLRLHQHNIGYTKLPLLLLIPCQAPTALSLHYYTERENYYA